MTVNKRKGHDTCAPRAAGSSHAEKDGLAVRLVEPRNAPTVINSCLNVRNFWDGRANNIFNGVSPFGNRDPDARVWMRKGRNAVAVRLEVTNASCASQATGPVLSPTEMSCDGRSFADVGRKLLDREPLAYQHVAATDSVLGDLFSYRLKRGHAHSAERQGKHHGKPELTYRDLVQKAFVKELWDGKTQSGKPLAAENFSLFFGLAVQAYERTLFSDKSRFDELPRENGEPIRQADGTYQGLTASESRGLDLFMGRVSVLNPQIGTDADGNPVPQLNGRCIVCHDGPEFTSAAYTSVTAKKKLPSPKFQVGLMPFVTATAGLMKDPNVIDTTLPQRVWDTGFYNIGVTADAWDIGLGGLDPWGNPLSFSQQWVDSFGPAGQAALVDDFTIRTAFVDSSGNPIELTPTLAPAAVIGAFKTPTLRNVELTGPYYHNGSAATLEEMMVAYNPGGFFRNPAKHPALTGLGFAAAPDMVDVSNFLRTLTDPRVRYEQAPFDHPELPLLHGHAIDANGQLVADPQNPSQAADLVEVLPAVGREGRAEPLPEFAAELSP
ncbi:hypothetical protein EWI61_06135 [Methylolobus aquaticus]|nr:hypothetical protein EWI61_06135 [Methylolobus aquaticus]